MKADLLLDILIIQKQSDPFTICTYFSFVLCYCCRSLHILFVCTIHTVRITDIYDGVGDSPDILEFV